MTSGSNWRTSSHEATTLPAVPPDSTWIENMCVICPCPLHHLCFILHTIQSKWLRREWAGVKALESLGNRTALVNFALGQKALSRLPEAVWIRKQIHRKCQSASTNIDWFSGQGTLISAYNQAAIIPGPIQLALSILPSLCFSHLLFSSSVSASISTLISWACSDKHPGI